MKTSLTPRERFNRSMRFQPVDRLPMLYNGVWRDTKQRWLAEGMRDMSEEIAVFDGRWQICWLYGKFQGPIPPFEERTMFESDEYQDAQNYLGQKERRLKNATSMPFFFDYPVKSRSDWEAYKKRFNPASEMAFD